MPTASPIPRRTALPSWFDARIVAGVLLVAAATIGCARLVAAADHRVTVVALRGDRAAGSVLRPSDLASVRVRLPGSALRRYVRTAADASGHTLNRPERGGELLSTTALDTLPPATTVVIPFDAGAAPRLSAGQRVTVWLAAKSCPARVLLADVTVQDVRDRDAGSFSSAGGQSAVVALDPQRADRAVRALTLDGMSLHAGIVTGDSPAASAEQPIDDCLSGRP